LKSSGAIFGFLVVFVITLGAGCAAEFQVLSVEPQKVSLDIDPNFRVSGEELNTSVSGFGSYNMMLNGSNPEDGRLFLSIYSIYDETLKQMAPQSVVDLFLGRELSILESGGDVITGEWTAVNAAGQNVTVYNISTTNPRVTPSNYHMTMWALDEDSYAMMASIMNMNATEKVINTLKLV